jgi:acetyl esterase
MSSTPTVHPEMDALVQARSKETAKTIADTRRLWNEYAARLSRPHPAHLAVEDINVPAQDRQIPVRVYRHKAKSGPQPCIVYLHGGGFIKGDLDSSDSVAWGFADETGAMVVSVDYRLAPEHPWPAGFDDGYDALAWIADNAATFGVDKDRIIVAGDSAGGRYTACICMKARDANGPKIAAQVMLYTSAGPAERSRSREDFASGYGLTAADSVMFRKALFPTDKYDNDPIVWPLKAADVSNLPPALIHSAEIDPIRDDGRAYAAKLILAGNRVTYREAKGMLHGFMRARFFGPDAKAEFDYICEFMRAHLR